MNLSQLYYFRKLAEVKHYTHAAEELFISQPTLSNSISQLERELGIPLFEREGRKIKLTKYGEEFYQYATEAVNALEKGIALAHEHAGSPTGSIDIGAIYTIQSDYLPSLIKGYRDQYGKDAQVNVFQGLTQPLLEDLESNRYELAFTAYVDSKPDLTFVPVLTQRLVAVVHRSDKLAWSKNLTLDSLRGRDIITYPPTTPIGAEVSALMTTHGLSATRTYANDEITLGSMVESTPGTIGLALDTIGLVPFRELITKRLPTTTSTRYASPLKPPHIKHAPLRTSSNSPDLSNGTTNGNRWLKNQRPPYNTRRHERNPIGPSSTRAATRTVHKKPSRQSQAMPRQLTARILSVENPYSWLFRAMGNHASNSFKKRAAPFRARPFSEAIDWSECYSVQSACRPFILPKQKMPSSRTTTMSTIATVNRML